MKTILNILSWLGLILTLLPAILLLADILSMPQVHTSMTVGMFLWFVARTLRETTFRSTGGQESKSEQSTSKSKIKK